MTITPWCAHNKSISDFEGTRRRVLFYFNEEAKFHKNKYLPSFVQPELIKISDLIVSINVNKTLAANLANIYLLYCAFWYATQ